MSEINRIVHSLRIGGDIMREDVASLLNNYAMLLMRYNALQLLVEGVEGKPCPSAAWFADGVETVVTETIGKIVNGSIEERTATWGK